MMKLNIPLEAMNTAECSKNNCDTQSIKIHVAAERKISTLTRILEPTFYEPFSFIFIAGLEHGLMSSNEDECSTTDLFQTLITKVNQMQPLPKFLVFCGGLTKNGEIKDSRKVLENALNSLDRNIKITCVPGESDFGHDMDVKIVDAYRNELGDDWYSFWTCGVAFLAFNSLYFKQQQEKELEDLSREQEDWFESEMIQCQFSKAKWTIVFQDRPWFTENPEEENTEKNIEKETRNRMLTKFKEAGVSHIFCRQSTDINITATDYNLELIATPSFNKENPIVRLVTITGDTIQHKIYDISSLPQFIAI